MSWLVKFLAGESVYRPNQAMSLEVMTYQSQSILFRYLKTTCGENDSSHNIEIRMIFGQLRYAKEKAS